MAVTADLLEIYHTGASSHAAAQADPDASLGNFRSSTRSHSLGFVVLNGLPNVRIDYVSGNNGVGSGAVTATASGSLAWTAPGSTTPGTAVAIANGETKKLLDGTDADKFIEVTRTSTDNLVPSVMTILCQDIFNNAIGKDNWSAAEQDAGDTEYRAVALLNTSGTETFTMRVWLGTLGTAATVDASNYAASGAVTITAKSGTDFDDWPASGGVQNTDTNETLYYTSRTDSALTVPAAGRDVWSDVSGGAAGTLDDNLEAVPMVRLAWSIPFSQPSGAFQTIADEDTAPEPGFGLMNFGTGPFGDGTSTFTSSTTAGSGLSIAFAVSEQYALWIEHKIIATATAEPTILTPIEFDLDSTYDGELRGRNRLQDDDLPNYLVFRGTGAEPDPETDSPYETFNTLPHTTAAQSVGTNYYFILRSQNDYGVRSKNLASWYLSLDGSGDQNATPPTAPEYVSVVAADAGTVDAFFDYSRLVDLSANRADTWAIWYTTDGSTPDPDVDPVTATETMQFVGDVARLRYQVPAQVDGTTVKVIVRTRLAGSPDVDSTNTTIYTITADTDGPATPSRTTIHHGNITEEHND